MTWRPFGRRTPILDELSLRIPAEERVLLAGPSGSGKSTLLRALAGLLLTTDSGDLSGSVRVGGLDPQSEPGLVGLVLQDPVSGVVASSLRRDVAFGLENLGMPREQMAAPVAAALASVRLTMDPSSSTSALSGGEQQRLALAGALAMSPRLLLLDEPTAMLDPDNAAAVRTVVREVVAERGLTTVVVEHRLGPWLDFVDRLVVIDALGRVIADGTPGAVLARHGEALVSQGIWVPGHADPEPLDLSLTFAAPAVTGGGVAVSAREVTVRHTSRPLNLPERVVTAVRGASLDVRAGRSVALVGPSGSGKSSLMAALGGLVAPSAGSVAFASALGEGPPHRWSSQQLARAVAWVPQRAASTLVARTVRDEVLTTPRALGMVTSGASAESAPRLPVQAGGDTQARAEALMAALGLGHLAGADPRQLSGGEQRRLAIAAAVVHQPALVLADEPTVGQDRLTWAAVMGVLEAMREAGSAVVVTTHDEGLQKAADEVVEMRAPGRDPNPARANPEARLRPLAARAGPLSLMLTSLLVLPLPALLDTWRQALAVLAVEVVLGLLAVIAWGSGTGAAMPVRRLRGIVVRLLPALLGVVGVGWSAWLLGGRDIEVAAGAGARVLCLVLPSVLLMPFVDPDALGDHLGQRLRLPARPVVAATAALQRFQAFGQLWSELMLARRVRGVGAGRSLVARAREVAAVTFALFVGTLGQAADLALAMDARGFARASRRTWAGPAPWRWADWVILGGGLLVVAAGVTAHILLPG